MPCGAPKAHDVFHELWNEKKLTEHPFLYLDFLPESGMSEARVCVVKLVDDHGVEHSVRVRAESVYEAAMRGLQKLERIGWESDGSQIGWLMLKFGRNQLNIGFTSAKCSDG